MSTMSDLLKFFCGDYASKGTILTHTINAAIRKQTHLNALDTDQRNFNLQPAHPVY